MTPVERPNLRYPLLRKGGLGSAVTVVFTASMLALMIRIAIHSKESPFMWGVAGLTCLFLLFLGARAVTDFVRYRNADLVADDEGVAIVRGGMRYGLPWKEIIGYQLSDTHFGTVLELKGTQTSVKLFLPGSSWALAFGGVSNALDCHLTSQGLPAKINIPDSEVGRRMLLHFHAPPPVEMEPDVPYRYADPARLAEMLVSLTSTFGFLCFFLGAMFVNIVRFLPNPWLISGIVAAILLSAIAFLFFVNRRLRSHLKDRFVLRNGELFVIRNGQESALPPAEPSTRRVLGQPLTKYGRGPFAYYMTPQFLEPDTVA